MEIFKKRKTCKGSSRDIVCRAGQWQDSNESAVWCSFDPEMGSPSGQRQWIRSSHSHSTAPVSAKGDWNPGGSGDEKAGSSDRPPRLGGVRGQEIGRKDNDSWQKGFFFSPPETKAFLASTVGLLGCTLHPVTYVISGIARLASAHP